MPFKHSRLWITARRSASNRDCFLQPGCARFASTSADARNQILSSNLSDAVKVFRLLHAFRRRGHLAAQLDPLRGSLHRELDPAEPIAWRLGGRHGEHLSNIDVCRLLRNYPKLDLSVFELDAYSEEDELPEDFVVPPIWEDATPRRWKFREFIEHLRSSYSNTVSLECQHIDNPLEREWLTDKIEGRFAVALQEAAEVRHQRQREALWRLVRSDRLEVFFRKKYPMAKGFGIEGCEALLPGLWAMLESFSRNGGESVQIGMAHRGRLNVLVNLLGKEVSAVCSEFGEHSEKIGDVKYHLGTIGTREVDGRAIELTLSPNPSHLEAVTPVVLGMTRAKQDYNDDVDMRKAMAVLLHGDASFCGQGVVAESMQLADLPAYTTGGTVHIVLNNLVGFTTDPRFARSSYHCTNFGKVNDAPILHVNADDIDAVLFACSLAAEYRQAWRKDVVLDLVCYRKHGHNELDDGSISQPLSHNLVRKHQPVLELYSEQLIKAGIVSKDDVDAKLEQVYTELEEGYHFAEAETQMSDWQVKQWPDRPVNPTGLPEARLTDIGIACSRIPDNFEAHATVIKLFEARRRQLKEGRVDWALAEQLALGSLLLHFKPRLSSTGLDYVPHPPCPVRLSGQDVERGTFNQRHAVIYDQRSAQPYGVLQNMNLGPQSKALVCNSSLSEYAIMGFEYGYSLEESLALTIWEAQFGDFANVAQPVIDNFIASGESKWETKSCLVLMLPHGYEGQGPEHSSARLERFLQLVNDDADNLWPRSRKSEMPHVAVDAVSREDAVEAVAQALACIESGDDVAFRKIMRRVKELQEVYDHFHNIIVVNLTTPANVFHVLRRQVHRTFAKPLVMMTAKYLLQHRPCRSPLSHMAKGTWFQPLIFEGGPVDNMPEPKSTGPVRRLIFCSGKVFYELYHARASRKLGGQIVLARMEQIAPFPALEVAICAGKYPTAEILWVQEEPKNMGAWTYVGPRLATAMRQLCSPGSDRPVRYVGRPPTANPATGVFKKHKKEARKFLDEALGL